jgi:L-alanine-DL-glutamate epimerase-like enolase superfamily enzyme
MWRWFGGREHRLRTDITITTGTVAQAQASTRKFQSLGFDRFKIKVGGSNLDHDVERVRAIAELAPAAGLILDGNTAFTAHSALSFLTSLGDARDQVLCFEQPVARDDWEGLREVEMTSGTCVVADESLRSKQDFQRLLRLGGVSGVNIKTAKLGLLEAWDLFIAARAAGFKIMVGGMVETELSMTASACLAAGVGGADFVDLDTPLLLGPRPLQGGFAQDGPNLDLSELGPGHGVSVL